MNKPTPLPWFYTKNYYGHCVMSSATFFDKVADKYKPVTVAYKILEADAKFIVKGGNAHDALVEALDGLLAVTCPNDDIEDSATNVAMKKAEAALKLAQLVPRKPGSIKEA